MQISTENKRVEIDRKRYKTAIKLPYSGNLNEIVEDEKVRAENAIYEVLSQFFTIDVSETNKPYELEISVSKPVSDREYMTYIDEKDGYLLILSDIGLYEKIFSVFKQILIFSSKKDFHKVMIIKSR
jgi:hypothetical protein